MMRQLSAEFFARSPLLAWPVFALAIFFTLFLVISLRALLGRKDEMEHLAALPLTDAEVNEHV
jgi:cbb3-type cytochrome oxidase subunit 3